MRFAVLGPVEVIVESGRFTVRRAQARGVLALLLIHAGRPVSSAAIEEALWAGATPGTARAQVHAAISSIRALLARLERPHAVLSGRFGYRLEVPPDEVDVHLFDQLVRRAREQTQPEAATGLLREALALWRGQALADATGVFVDAVRAELVERRLAAVEDLAEHELRLGRHTDVAAELAPLVVEHPFRERLRVRLMLALHGSGRQAEALRNFHEYRRMLAEHDGLDPGAELAELATAVLRDDPRLALSYQPVADPTARAPAQLPADVPDFIGRSGYVEALDQILDAAAGGPAPPVLISAIDGMAGVGKTTLAVHWARRVRGRFGDGQLYLNLRGYSEAPALRPREALAHLLYGLGVPAADVPVDVDDAASLFRTVVAEKRLLLLLDNARSADQVRPLLPGGDRCLVLITSRHQLGGLVALEGARQLTLDVLAPEESRALLVRVLGTAATEAEPGPVDELAELCARLPLALRIAAANLASRADWEPGAIGEYVCELRTGNRLAGLEVPGDPQAAVCAAFDLSYRSLSAPARRHFRLLGLVPGADVTVEAAAALVDQPEPRVLAALTELVRKHLLSLTGGRYSMHELLRAHARACAEREESEAARESAQARLFDHYLSMANAAASVAYPQTVRLPATDVPESAQPVTFADARAALAWLEAERHNLVAAVRFTADQAGLRPYSWRLADALRGYFWIRRYYADWLTTGEVGLAGAVAAGDRAGQAAVRLSLGVALRSLSQHGEAIAHLDASLGLCRELGWLEGEGTCLGSLATTYAEIGQLRRAVDHVSQSLVLSRRTGREASEAVQLGNRGNMRMLLGDLDDSAADMAAALALHQKAGNLAAEAVLLGALGLVGFCRGEYAAAMEDAEQGVRVSREVGDRYCEAFAMAAIAQIHLARNRPDLARPVAEDAYRLTREISDKWTQTYVLIVVGQVLRAGGDASAAADRFTDALNLARTHGNRHGTAEALVDLAETYHELGALDDAMSCATEALAIARQNGYQIFVSMAQTVTAAIHLARGERQRAVATAEEALAGHRTTGYRCGIEQTEALLLAARPA